MGVEMISENLDNSNVLTQEKIIRHGAYGIVLQGSDILLTLKKSGPYQGLWDLPGGGIEFGETPEEALKREFIEESALNVNQMELFTITTATGDYWKNNLPYSFHQVGLIYKVLSWSEQPNCSPQEENLWVQLGSVMHQNLTPFASQVVAKLEKNSKAWRPPNRIRGRAIGLAQQDNNLLVCEVLDDDERLKGWCPIGGGIEFGEKAEDAARREIREELGTEATIIGDPIICESIFEHHGVTGHEVVFAFPVILENKELYSKKRFQIYESSGSLHWVEWVSIDDFKQGKAVLFPEIIVKYI